MGCACSGKKNGNQRWIYTDPNGRQSTHQTEVSAKAAKIRNGNRGSIRVEPK